jgi:hypothetical protein
LTVFEPIRLNRWEEGALRLGDLAEEDGYLIATGDKVKFRLPLELKDDLRNNVGMRISILRTDSTYLIRIQGAQS